MKGLPNSVMVYTFNVLPANVKHSYNIQPLLMASNLYPKTLECWRSSDAKRETDLKLLKNLSPLKCRKIKLGTNVKNMTKLRRCIVTRMSA